MGKRTYRKTEKPLTRECRDCHEVKYLATEFPRGHGHICRRCQVKRSAAWNKRAKMPPPKPKALPPRAPVMARPYETLVSWLTPIWGEPRTWTRTQHHIATNVLRARIGLAPMPHRADLDDAFRYARTDQTTRQAA